MINVTPSALERFWPKVQKTDTCWLWMAGTWHHGYGSFYLDGTHEGAHRVSYTIAKGQIPDGLEIDHLCYVTNCVNPDHLEAVTTEENQRRRRPHLVVGAWQAAKTHCPQGHEYTPENTFYRPDRVGRVCIPCRRAANRRCRARKRAQTSPSGPAAAL